MYIIIMLLPSRRSVLSARLTNTPTGSFINNWKCKFQEPKACCCLLCCLLTLPNHINLISAWGDFGKLSGSCWQANQLIVLFKFRMLWLMWFCLSRFPWTSNCAENGSFSNPPEACYIFADLTSRSAISNWRKLCKGIAEGAYKHKLHVIMEMCFRFITFAYALHDAYDDK